MCDTRVNRCNLDAQGAVGNQPVSFWQGTTVVKTANTNTYGVATYLFAPTTFNNVGTYPAAFVANFAGSTNYAAATSVTGTLKVSSAQTTFSSTVYGTWNASTGSSICTPPCPRRPRTREFRANRSLLMSTDTLSLSPLTAAGTPRTQSTSPSQTPTRATLTNRGTLLTFRPHSMAAPTMFWPLASAM